MSSFGVWDWALVVMVTAQAGALAYLHRPEYKALILSLPIPFTLASLALGQRVDARNIAALLVLLFFFHGVRLFHHRLRLPIVPSIALSAAGYCGVALAFGSWRPPDVAYWWAAGAMMLLAGVLTVITPARIEPGHRTPLPVYLKLPIIAAVIIGLVLLKSRMQAFMTVFPMVSVVACYEARHSLYTLARQIPVLILAMIPFMTVCRGLSPHLGLGPALLIGWVAFLAVLLPLSYWLKRRAESVAAAPAEAAG